MRDKAHRLNPTHEALSSGHGAVCGSHAGFACAVP